ncbi:MAG: hypothetical protein K6T61_18010, partial [Bryobacteraceae bacterium]|nr:hypothetical protein [Bryobacteraceae bacterium]
MKAIIGLSGLLLLICCSRPDRALYPLNEALTWEYQISARSMLGSAPVLRATVANLPQRQLSGRRVTPQKVDIGQQ